MSFQQVCSEITDAVMAVLEDSLRWLKPFVLDQYDQTDVRGWYRIRERDRGNVCATIAIADNPQMGVAYVIFHPVAYSQMNRREFAKNMAKKTGYRIIIQSERQPHLPQHL